MGIGNVPLNSRGMLSVHYSSAHRRDSQRGTEPVATSTHNIVLVVLKYHFSLQTTITMVAKSRAARRNDGIQVSDKKCAK